MEPPTGEIEEAEATKRDCRIYVGIYLAGLECITEWGDHDLDSAVAASTGRCPRHGVPESTEFT